MDLFLDWIGKNRSWDTYETRTTACSRFGAFMVGQQKLRELPANKITSDDLAALLKHLAEDGVYPHKPGDTTKPRSSTAGTGPRSIRHRFRTCRRLTAHSLPWNGPGAGRRVAGECGIWRLITNPPSEWASWTPDERRLVAIQTSCKYGAFLKGTWIRHAFGLIYHDAQNYAS